jgi:3-(methylthio)propionyl---CoA ligase
MSRVTPSQPEAAMQGLMMDRPLLISSLLEHAAEVFPAVEIVTRTVEGPIHRSTWAAVQKRARQVAQALHSLELREGDAVATIAWNTHRHLELYYGVSGMGAVVHTVNPRLHPSQLVYVLNHAQDRALFVDLTFVPLVEAVLDKLATVRHVVVMTDRAHMPDCRIPGALCYEELLSAQDGRYDWPTFDERTAAGICYTSGTTGNPKGVVYSHRSSVLHAFGVALPGCLPVGPGEVLLPVVPMFHVNAWGIPYGAAMSGYKLVLPGPRLDGPGLTELMNAEHVTTYCGVPTVHLGLLAHWRASGESVPSLRTVTTGGAAPTSAMIEEFRSRGIGVVHGWGMTETSPVGTLSRITVAEEGLDSAAQVAFLMRQGRKLFGVELRLVDAEGRSLPRDRRSVGELQIRGPWVCSAYLGDAPGSALDAEGWFSTGDMAVIHPDGTVQITDRKKDLIKSGGEWISSLDLEEAAARHPEIALAAVIGIPHEKWGERPLLIAQPAPGASPTKESVLEFLEGQVAKLWLPDDVVFVDSLPLGPTGKVQKMALRERFGS